MKTVWAFLKKLCCTHRWIFAERMPAGIVRVMCLRCGMEKVEHRA